MKHTSINEHPSKLVNTGMTYKKLILKYSAQFGF